MNKSLVIITLFVGFLVSASKSDAAVPAGVSHDPKLQGLETTHDNPWDPRGNEATDSSENQNSDSSGKEVLPEPEQSESLTEE